jgi:hypothetical protein
VDKNSRFGIRLPFLTIMMSNHVHLLVQDGEKGSSVELINTGNDLFDPISEPFFLHHPGFYPATTPTYCRITANPEILRHLRQGPVATPLHQIHR